MFLFGVPLMGYSSDLHRPNAEIFIFLDQQSGQNRRSKSHFDSILLSCVINYIDHN